MSDIASGRAKYLQELIVRIMVDQRKAMDVLEWTIVFREVFKDPTIREVLKERLNNNDDIKQE